MKVFGLDAAVLVKNCC